MPLRMTNFSFVPSCFDNTVYRMMCPPYICHWQPK